MELRNLGSSGLRVSLVGLGCNNFGGRIDLEASRAVVHRALDLGITLFDTADIYGTSGGSETALGKLLGPKRKEIVLATKFGMVMDEARELKGASRRYIMTAVEASLTRLRTDHIDLYQLHIFDPLTPIEETLRALDDLMRQGKVRYVGCSKLPAWRVTEAHWTARSRGFDGFVSIQDEYSLLARGIERDLIPVAQTYGLGLLPYFPLASGMLTGKYRRGQEAAADFRFAKMPALGARYLTEANFAILEKLEAFAASHGHTILELAFSWLAARAPVASVIAGATKPEQVEQNVKAVAWRLSAADLAEIDRLTGTG